MVVVVCKYENVYIDILVYIIKWLFGKLVWFMKIDMGQCKVLFGINYLMIVYMYVLIGFDELGLSDEVCCDFLYGNVVWVFKLDL